MGYGRQRGAWLALLLSLLLAGGLGPVSSARATFPGSNGVLAFERSVSTPALGWSTRMKKSHRCADRRGADRS